MPLIFIWAPRLSKPPRVFIHWCQPRYLPLSLIHIYAGYQVSVAEDGVQALELFHKGSYALVLLDLMLPKIDGFGVCEVIRRESDLPILMLTALDLSLIHI